MRTSHLASGKNIQQGPAAKLTVPLSAATTLTSLTAYRKSDYHFLIDSDATELPVVTSASPSHIRLFERRPMSVTAPLARRTVARVHLERDWRLRGVRPIVSCDRTQTPGVDAGRLEPQWRRDGTELLYMAPNQTLMAVVVKSNSTTLEVSPPRALFATQIK